MPANLSLLLYSQFPFQIGGLLFNDVMPREYYQSFLSLPMFVHKINKQYILILQLQGNIRTSGCCSSSMKIYFTE